jgi:hypothetical protein
MATIQNWSKDHVQLIVAYLDPIDIVFLARACPRLARLLKGHLLPRLAQKIDRHFRQHFGIEYYDEFVAMMRRTETCVSGSFVLQMLLLVEGKVWVGSDIDLFATKVDGKTEPEHHNFFCEVQGYSLDRTFYSHAPKEIELVNSYRCTDLRATQRVRLILPRPHSFLMKNFTKFEIVTLKNATTRQDILDFIKGTFDFNVLMNIFYYDEKGPQVEISDLSSILKMVIKFNPHAFISKTPDQEPVRLAERMKKYEERGFTFVEPEWESVRYKPGKYHRK